MPHSFSQMRKRFAQDAKAARALVRNNGWLFTPGALVIALGVMMFVAPQFLVYIGAAFLLLVGTLLMFLGWKLLVLKRKVETLVKNIEGKIYVQTTQVRSPIDQMESLHEEQQQQKKIIFH
jgi:hypothetical protein